MVESTARGMTTVGHKDTRMQYALLALEILGAMSSRVLSNVFNLSEKTIFITGGSSGLGEHFARLLASAGAPNIVLAARRKEKLNKVQEDISSTYPSCNVVAVAMDVRSKKSICEAFDHRGKGSW